MGGTASGPSASDGQQQHYHELQQNGPLEYYHWMNSIDQVLDDNQLAPEEAWIRAEDFMSKIKLLDCTLPDAKREIMVQRRLPDETAVIQWLAKIEGKYTAYAKLIPHIRAHQQNTAANAQVPLIMHKAMGDAVADIHAKHEEKTQEVHQLNAELKKKHTQLQQEQDKSFLERCCGHHGSHPKGGYELHDLGGPFASSKVDGSTPVSGAQPGYRDQAAAYGHQAAAKFQEAQYQGGVAMHNAGQRIRPATGVQGTMQEAAYQSQVSVHNAGQHASAYGAQASGGLQNAGQQAQTAASGYGQQVQNYGSPQPAPAQHGWMG